MSSDEFLHENIDLAFTRENGPTGTMAEKAYSGATSFFRRLYTKDLENVDVAVVGVPFDHATSGRPGARFGPRGVRQASSMVAWDNVWGWDFDPFERLSVTDFGDVKFDFGRLNEAVDEIEEQFRRIHEKGIATLMIGGDHFSTFPTIKSLASFHETPLSLIHFDAHTDSWDDEDGRIDHGTMFFHAAKQGLIDSKRSVQIGIRTNNKNTLGFNIIDVNEAVKMDAEELGRKVKQIVGDAPVYLTFDIDCLDPAFAPGTGTPVSGGLSPLQAYQILRSLRGINLKSADVVEVAPIYDQSEITALAAATIGLHCLALMGATR